MPGSVLFDVARKLGQMPELAGGNRGHRAASRSRSTSAVASHGINGTGIAGIAALDEFPRYFGKNGGE
jgi:hypothetical protein